MQITGSNTYPPVSIALPSRNLLPVVLRPGIAKQERQQLRRRGPDPSDHGCTLRSTHTCPVSQRDDQATAFSGTHHPWQVCQQVLDIDPVDAFMLHPGSASETDARVAVEGDTVTVQYKCMNSKGEVNDSLCKAST